MTGPTLGRGPGLALLTWAVHFAIMYGLATFACDRPALGWIATAAGAIVTLAVLLRARPTPAADARDLGRGATAVVAFLALVAILWHGFAVLSLPACPR